MKWTLLLFGPAAVVWQIGPREAEAAPRVDRLVNAASLSVAGPVAPGSLVSLFGEGLAANAAVAAGYPLPVELGAATVRINGVAAPLLYASPSQINLQVPFDVSGARAAVSVSVRGVTGGSLEVPLAPAAPALFSLLANGTGPAALLDADARVVSRENPVVPGGWVSLYATGLGAASGETPARATVVVRVFFDELEAEVSFAGLAPGFAGLNQINARVPEGLRSRFPRVYVEAGGARSANVVTAGGPGILDVNPLVIPVGADARVEVRGLNFAPSATMEIGGLRISGAVVAGPLQVFQAVVPAALIPASGRFSVTVNNNDGDPNSRSNAVELAVATPAPLLVSSSEVRLNSAGQCPSGPVQETVSVSSPGAASLRWSAVTSGEPWLAVSPSQGTTPQSVTVAANPAGLAPGQYTGSVTITPASGPAQQIRVILTVSPAPVAPPRVTSPNVYVLDSLRRVLENDPLPASPARSATLAGARGEYEAFQVIIHGGSGGLAGVNAELVSPLTGPGCASIPSRHVVFYREHYVNIARPSNDGAGGARPGVYPDALIPFRNPFTGEPLAGGAYPSAPFPVAAGRNQPVYIEVYVPPGMPAGSYSGLVRLTRNSSEMLAEVPVSLTVWNIDLPKKPSLKSAFHDYDSEHMIGPGRYYGYRRNSENHYALAVAIDEHLLEHRLIPEVPIYSYFDVDSNGRIAASAQREAAIEALVRREDRSTLKFYFEENAPFLNPLTQDRAKVIAYLRDAYDWLSRRGLLDKVFFRPQDEPQSDAEFQKTRAFADLIHEANPNFKVAITGDFDQPGFERYLYGALDIFVMGFAAFDPVTLARRQAAGDTFWSYTGLVEYPHNPTPYWQIEFPLLGFRVVPWINFRYGLKGLLYWTTAYWNEVRARGQSPWTDPCSLRASGVCFNGDGMLIYPGREVNLVVPREAYGPLSAAQVFGVVPSLRLKALRDGMEDYELLTLAAARNRVEAMQAVFQVACGGNAAPGDARLNCFHTWSKDPDSVSQARSRLAAILAAN